MPTCEESSPSASRSAACSRARSAERPRARAPAQSRCMSSRRIRAAGRHQPWASRDADLRTAAAPSAVSHGSRRRCPACRASSWARRSSAAAATAAACARHAALGERWRARGPLRAHREPQLGGGLLRRRGSSAPSRARSAGSSRTSCVRSRAARLAARRAARRAAWSAAWSTARRAAWSAAWSTASDVVRRRAGSRSAACRPAWDLLRGRPSRASESPCAAARHRLRRRARLAVAPVLAAHQGEHADGRDSNEHECPDHEARLSRRCGRSVRRVELDRAALSV